jgi:hypothetical protein
MQFSLHSLHSIPLRSKYTTQQPVLEQLLSMKYGVFWDVTPCSSFSICISSQHASVASCGYVPPPPPPPKSRLLQEPHGVTSQKTPHFTITAVKATNLTTSVYVPPLMPETVEFHPFLSRQLLNGFLLNLALRSTLNFTGLPSVKLEVISNSVGQQIEGV